MRVSIVNGICVRHDAISEAVLGTQRAVAELYGVEPIIYCYSCDYSNVKYRIVNSSGEMALDHHLMNSDLVIYHFGIFYGLFDSIFLNTAAKKIVRYHNVTPANLAPPSQHAVIARSERQKANMAQADAIWADSEFNKRDLLEYGIDPSIISVEPLFLKFERRAPAPARSGAVELLFVGRFVESKGVVDLIEAVAKVRSQSSAAMKLRLVGNVNFSDPSFLAKIRQLVEVLNLRDIVQFEGRVDDDRLAELYAQADIFLLPSYHEGFCVPLIEALHSRCVPITYDAGNLAALVDRWGVTVSTGDRAAFAAALADLVDQFKGGRPGRIRIAGWDVNWTDWDRGVANYLETFSFQSYRERTRTGIERVLPTTRRLQPAP